MITSTQPINEVPMIVSREEIELLLCCVSPQIDIATTERIKKLVEQNIDWTYLLETAAFHGVMPLLYHNLTKICPESVPKAVICRLLIEFHFNTQRNLVLKDELLKLLRLFEENNIPVIPFKGLVLAASSYSNLALRQISDIDIFVDKPNIEKAKELLISQGYQMPSNEEVDPIKQFEQSHAWQMVNPERLCSVDLHWNIAPIQYVSSLTSFKTLWERLESTFVDNVELPNLNAEDLLLILCLHGNGEVWKNLKRCCDIAYLIHTHEEINWTRILEQAGKLNIKIELFFGLSIVNQLLGVPLPEFVQKMIQANSFVQWFIPEMKEWLFVNDQKSGVFDSRFVYLLMQKSWLYRIKYALKLGLTPNEKDRELLALPNFLFPLYFFIRPIRLFKTYNLNLRKINLAFKSLLNKDFY